MPTITVPRNQVLVNEGETAELVCNVHGVPQPRLTWQRNGIQVGNYGRCTSVTFMNAHNLNFTVDVR